MPITNRLEGFLFWKWDANRKMLFRKWFAKPVVEVIVWFAFTMMVALPVHIYKYYVQPENFWFVVAVWVWIWFGVDLYAKKYHMDRS